jgi:hypothetical protein
MSVPRIQPRFSAGTQLLLLFPDPNLLLHPFSTIAFSPLLRTQRTRSRLTPQGPTSSSWDSQTTQSFCTTWKHGSSRAGRNTCAIRYRNDSLAPTSPFSASHSRRHGAARKRREDGGPCSGARLGSARFLWKGRLVAAGRRRRATKSGNFILPQLFAPIPRR